MFSGSQIICQKTQLFLPLLKTELLNRYSLFFFPTLHSFNLLHFWIYSFPFFFFFLLSLERSWWEIVSNISYFSSCLFFLYKEPNAPNRDKIFCDCISIQDHLFWTPIFKLPLQDKQTKQTKTEIKQNSKELDVTLQSHLILKISMTKTTNVCRNSTECSITLPMKNTFPNSKKNAFLWHLDLLCYLSTQILPYQPKPWWTKHPLMEHPFKYLILL